MTAPERDPLEVWRETFAGGELVAEGAQSELWLGDVDTPPATLDGVLESIGRAIAELPDHSRD